MTPSVTWSRLQPMLRDFGITRVADVTGLDRLGVPVFQAVRPSSRTVSLSQGKGLLAMSARVSAAMEAVELWHAESLDADAGVLAPARELALPYPLTSLDRAPDSAVHPDLPLRWLPAAGLGDGRATFVPLDLVRLDHTVGDSWAPALFRATSNGLASGNTVAEATVHALAELCERDALAALRGRPEDTWATVDLDSVPDPDVRGLLDRVTADGSSVEVVAAHDDPPCFEARLRSPDHPVTYTGAGSHPDPLVALQRAVTEACQSRLTGITGARDDLPPALYRPVDPTVSRATPRRRTSPAPWTRWAGAAHGPASARSRGPEDLDGLVGAIAARTGHQPLRVVLRDEFPAVVKVVAPGLRFDDRVDVTRPAAGGA